MQEDFLRLHVAIGLHGEDREGCNSGWICTGEYAENGDINLQAVSTMSYNQIMQPTARIPQQLSPLPIALRPTPLLSNFFTPSNPNLHIHLYSLDFQPAVDNENRTLRRTLLRSADEQLTKLVGGHIVSGINLFALKENVTVMTVECVSEGVTYGLTLRHVRVVTMEMEQGRKDTQLVLNVILKRALREMGLKQITRLPKFYDPDPKRRVPLPQYGIEIWRGYTTEITLRHGGPYVNIDFSSKIVHTRSVKDEMQEVRRNTQGGDWIEVMKAKLEGRIVMTQYGNNRCYRIDEICMNKNPTNTFDRNGVQISYMEYYRSQYNKNISDSKQPLIRCHIKRRLEEFDIYLVPELMALTGLDDNMRADFRLMSEMANTTRLQPQKRLDYSIHLAEGFNRHPGAKKVLTEFDFQVDQTPHRVPSYNLSGESVNLTRPVQIGKDGNFQVRGEILDPVPLQNWVVMRTERDTRNAQEFVTAMHRKLGEMRITNTDPAMVNYEPRTFAATLQRMMDNQEKPQIVVILLPKDRKRDYEMIKRTTTTAAVVVTQVVMVPINEKRFQSIVEKVALQIQAKIGAQLWTVRPSLAFGKYLMVVGIDVYHDTVNRRQSVLGFCATIHPNMSKYYSTIAMHETGQEVSATIGNLFHEALLAFKNKSGHNPETVIFFRDGVGDSQFQAVKEFEVASVLSTCQRIREGETVYSPNIIYTVVAKKTSARFFAGNTPGKVENPAPGTLIVSEVVPESGDFYLISHYANQGMSAPSLYRTVYASHPEPFPLEELARLAYKLCHMYYNWSGAIKVPAPCMMAHKLALLVGQCVHGAVSPDIRGKSFYL